MTWQAINDSELVSGSPVKSSIAFRLRDNTTAVANGDAGAPRIQNAALDTNSVTNIKVANGTLGAEKFQTGTDEVNWVMARIASASAGAVGDYVLAKFSGGSATYGNSIPANELTPSATDGSTIVGPTLSGLWVTLGFAATDDVTLFRRIS